MIFSAALTSLHEARGIDVINRIAELFSMIGHMEEDAVVVAAHTLLTTYDQVKDPEAQQMTLRLLDAVRVQMSDLCRQSPLDSERLRSRFERALNQPILDRFVSKLKISA